jgi:small subunit ribosomal protein S16
LAVKLRLRRMGKKKQPIYKVIAADARSPRDGKFIEAIGLYNPLTNPHTIQIKEDRALYWLGVGAQPTDTVRSLFRQAGISLKRELLKRGLSEEQVAVELGNWNSAKEAASAKKGQKKGTKGIQKEQSTAEVKGAASEETTVKTEE